MPHDPAEGLRRHATVQSRPAVQVPSVSTRQPATDPASLDLARDPAQRRPLGAMKKPAVTRSTRSRR